MLTCDVTKIEYISLRIRVLGENVILFNIRLLSNCTQISSPLTSYDRDLGELNVYLDKFILITYFLPSLIQ